MSAPAVMPRLDSVLAPRRSGVCPRRRLDLHRERTGRLVVIDLDQRDPIYLVNEACVTSTRSSAHLLVWSETTDGSRAETIRLRDALRDQDCIPAEELEPFWINIIDATLDEESSRFAVSLGAKNAYPTAKVDVPPTSGDGAVN